MRQLAQGLDAPFPFRTNAAPLGWPVPIWEAIRRHDDQPPSPVAKPRGSLAPQDGPRRKSPQPHVADPSPSLPRQEWGLVTQPPPRGRVAPPSPSQINQASPQVNPGKWEQREPGGGRLSNGRFERGEWGRFPGLARQGTAEAVSKTRP